MNEIFVQSFIKGIGKTLGCVITLTGLYILSLPFNNTFNWNLRNSNNITLQTQTDAHEETEQKINEFHQEYEKFRIESINMDSIETIESYQKQENVEELEENVEELEENVEELEENNKDQIRNLFNF